MIRMNRRQLLASTAVVTVASTFEPRPSVSNAITVRDVMEGHLRPLTKPGNGDNRATFMPHGETLLFASRRSGKSQIWQIDRSGENPRQFYKSADDDYGRVSPNSDGSRISFSSDRDGQNAIYVFDLATGATELVSDPVFWSFGPSRSTHDLIAFFSKKGGNALNIWTIHPDGSHAQQVTDQPGESRQPWWSPDGDTLAISCDHGTGKFAISLSRPDGSDARRITASGSCAQPFLEPRRQEDRGVRQVHGALFPYLCYECRWLALANNPTADWPR
jgi:Tol biopolymer transport system component